jgi:hypothetical protein
VFQIKTSGAKAKKHRLVSDGVLQKAEFERVTEALGAQPFKARKIAFVAARTAVRAEDVETHWNGKETRNTAQPGDSIVTSLTRRKTILRDKAGNANTYVIRADTFKRLYAPTRGKNKMGRFYKAKSVVTAIYLSGGFNIVAPWGKRERAPKGYLLFNGSEVYGNNAGTFQATYEITGQRRSKKVG